MDKQQLFLANNIFDIDSALDRLEENLFTSSEEKSAISTEPISQQIVDIVKQQQNKGFEEGNANETLSDGCESETLDDNKSESNESFFEFETKNRENNFSGTLDLETATVDDSRADETTIEDVIRTDTCDIDFTQTISAASFTINDQTQDSIISSSDSSDSEDLTNSSDDRDKVHLNSEITSQITSHMEHDESSKRLISDESSNQVEENVDDQPVTTDLTLTKTVELTENEPEPEQEEEPEAVPVEVDAQPESEQRTLNGGKFEIPQPIEAVMVRHVEEANDMKEMSLNNFESTMDDISDAELESLEQELEDLVAIVELSNEKSSSETAVKVLEDSIEKASEVKEETEAVIKIIEPEQPPPADPKELAKEEEETLKELKLKERKLDELPEDPSEIQEVRAVTEEQDVDQRESSAASEAQEAVEPSNIEPSATLTDADAAQPDISTSSTDESTSIQNLPSQSNEDFSINESNSTGSLTSAPDLGRVPPYWIPDSMTNQCMQCDAKFSLIKRRHHCRACGLLLCSTCCNEKFILPYLGSEGRICKNCLEILIVQAQQQQQNQPRNPNPANPMEYCSTLPPQQQVNVTATQPPVVMVPGVLKRGPRTSERKSVIFSDGIRPGTDLDETSANVPTRESVEKPPKFNMPTLNEKTNSFIPETTNELPPILLKESEFKFVDNNLSLVQRLRQEELKFAINKNFFVTVKIVTREFYISFLQ